MYEKLTSKLAKVNFIRCILIDGYMSFLICWASLKSFFFSIFMMNILRQSKHQRSITHHTKKLQFIWSITFRIQEKTKLKYSWFCGWKVEKIRKFLSNDLIEIGVKLAITNQLVLIILIYYKSIDFDQSFWDNLFFF